MNQPVFVVGCDRSGTTLLTLLLSQSPDLYMTLESGFIPDLNAKKNDYDDFSSAKNRWYFIRDLQTTNATSKTIAFDIFELSDDQAEETLHQVAPTDYSGAIDALFSKTAEINGKHRWGNKTPKYVHNLGLLTELFPDCKIVHIIRDPRDVAASIIRTGWTPTIKEAALFWKNRVTDGLKGRKFGEETYYELKYESLLENPEGELRDLYDWLNIRFEDDIIERYKEDADRMSIDKHKELFDAIGKPIDKSRAFAWKKEMKKADFAEIERINEDLIRKLNYELTNIGVPLRRKVFRAGYDFLLSVGEKVGRNIGKKL